MGSNGLPDASNSKAGNVFDIVKMFRQYSRATVAMVVMAHPLADGIAPLRICSFGSDNRFTSADVKNRLDFIKDILKKNDIEVLGYSTDGDSRELKMMREHLKLGTKKVNKVFSKRYTWFFADIINTCIPFQDTIHEGLKLKTRFLKTHMSLPFGN